MDGTDIKYSYTLDTTSVEVEVQLAKLTLQMYACKCAV